MIQWLQVLQRQMDLELELLEGKEERKAVLGRLYMLSLSSQVGFNLKPNSFRCENYLELIFSAGRP